MFLRIKAKSKTETRKIPDDLRTSYFIVPKSAQRIMGTYQKDTVAILKGRALTGLNWENLNIKIKIITI